MISPDSIRRLLALPVATRRRLGDCPGPGYAYHSGGWIGPWASNDLAANAYEAGYGFVPASEDAVFGVIIATVEELGWQVVGILVYRNPDETSRVVASGCPPGERRRFLEEDGPTLMDATLALLARVAGGDDGR